MAAVLLLAILLAGCGEHPEGDRSTADSPPPAQPRATEPRSGDLDIARQTLAARAEALTGHPEAANQRVATITRGVLQAARIPDPARPMPHEAARARIEQINGVHGAVWIDPHNLLVLVGGAQYRDTAMIDRICTAIAPLGDTLGVVVNVQNSSAMTAAESEAVSRDCQLPEGQRAFLQTKRQIEALDPATRRAFEAQNGRRSPYHQP